MRKTPVQSRAKARVASILDAAEAIIIESGVSNLTMERIAEKAGVSIGSLYQYFQSRDEIFQQLSRRYYGELEGLLEPYFKSIEKITDFIGDIEKTIRICWDYTLSNPGYRTIFFDVSAWEAVREIDWEDTQFNAQRIAQSIHPLMPLIEFDELLALGMIIGDSAASTARLATRFPDMKDRIFSQFLELITNQLFALVRANTEAELQSGRDELRAVKP